LEPRRRTSPVRPSTAPNWETDLEVLNTDPWGNGPVRVTTGDLDTSIEVLRDLVQRAKGQPAPGD